MSSSLKRLASTAPPATAFAASAHGRHSSRRHAALLLARGSTTTTNSRTLSVVQAHTAPPDAEQAEAHYRQALALANELGMRPLQAHCHRGLGTLYATTGQQEQARPALSTAIALYRAMEMTFWLPETEATLAQVEGR